MKSIRLHASALALALGFSLPAFAQALDANEQKLVAAVKARSDEALKLLERSVNINSGTLNQQGVREVGALFRAEFDALGFKTRWIEMPAEMKRAGHLVAEREGTQGKRLLLIGHLDTVFEKDSPVVKWERKGDRVRGQGVMDMKGGDVIIIEALRALKNIGALDNTRISVMFSGDEEAGGAPISVARADLLAMAKKADLALAFEFMVPDKDNNDTATIGRRSSGGFTLEVTGKTAHSMGVFGASGYGAAYETARILNAFREQVMEPDLTYNVGLIVSGTETSYDETTARATAFGKTNVVPKAALVKGDMRYMTAEQGERARGKMTAIVAQNLPGTSAAIKFNETYPPMAPTAGNQKLLELYSKVAQDAGMGKINAVPPGLRGAGDVQFVAPLLDSLDGLGANGKGAHSPDEELEIASIERMTIRTAIMLYRLTR